MSDGLRLRVAPSLAEIAPAAWNACAAGLPTGGEVESPSQEIPPNPFVSHEFLSALEDAGCLGPAAGWAPAHLLLEDASGALVATAPAYFKGHSRGEYVFDQSWAEAFARAGGRYYPKLQVSVPFTPAAGPRLLVRAGPDEAARRRALIAGLEALREQGSASSTHVTFAESADAAALEGAGYLPRHDIQFHWRNEGWRDFADFLDALASRKRKAIRRERRDALEGGVEIETLTGRDLTESVWDAFFAFYQDTGGRKWGRLYLNRRFFSLAGERLGGSIVLMMAKRAGRYIAGALNFRGADRLWGRYWGAIEDRPFLHFELCYHRAVEYALAHGLAVVEAGAQGEHKLARGYRPARTVSLHAIADPNFRAAVARYLTQERAAIAEALAELDAQSPYRRDGAA